MPKTPSAIVTRPKISKLNRSGKDMAAWQAEVWPAAVQAAEPYPNMPTLYAANGNADPEAGGETTSPTASPESSTPSKPASPAAEPGQRVMVTSEPILADS
jgi:hypothetical protein